MIWLEELQNQKEISIIFNRYEKTFPENERRNKEQFLALAENPDVIVFLIKNENEAIGYAVIWELSGFYFLEHFEVFQEVRNQKFGGKILAVLKKKYLKIVLESEPEILGEIAKRRIGFYERNGYSIISKKYLQPSYSDGNNAVDLFLLANFYPENIENLIKKIHKTVYTLNVP